MSGVRTHALIRGSDLKSDALDHSAIMTVQMESRQPVIAIRMPSAAPTHPLPGVGRCKTGCAAQFTVDVTAGS